MLEEQVWQAVEARNQAWVEDDRATYLAIHHPGYARWHRREPRLEERSDVEAFWNRVHDVEQSVSIEVVPERLQFLADGKVAVAHYTIGEVVEYRVDTQRGPNRFKAGDRAGYRIRFSDIYELRDGRWLYVGGHRDGASLPDRGEISLATEENRDEP